MQNVVTLSFIQFFATPSNSAHIWDSPVVKTVLEIFIYLFPSISKWLDVPDWELVGPECMTVTLTWANSTINQRWTIWIGNKVERKSIQIRHSSIINLINWLMQREELFSLMYIWFRWEKSIYKWCKLETAVKTFYERNWVYVAWG